MLFHLSLCNHNYWNCIPSAGVIFVPKCLETLCALSLVKSYWKNLPRSSIWSPSECLLVLNKVPWTCTALVPMWPIHSHNNITSNGIIWERAGHIKGQKVHWVRGHICVHWEEDRIWQIQGDHNEILEHVLLKPEEVLIKCYEWMKPQGLKNYIKHRPDHGWSTVQNSGWFIARGAWLHWRMCWGDSLG